MFRILNNVQSDTFSADVDGVNRMMRALTRSTFSSMFYTGTSADCRQRRLRDSAKYRIRICLFGVSPVAGRRNITPCTVFEDKIIIISPTNGLAFKIRN